MEVEELRKYRKKFLMIFFFQIEICASSKSSGCKEIDEVSDKLKTIYRSREVRIIQDVNLTVDIVENIVTSIRPENVNKTPEVRKASSKI